MARARKAARKSSISKLKARERRAERIAKEISKSVSNLRPMTNFSTPAKHITRDSLDRQTARASEKFQEAQRRFEPIFPRVAGKLEPEQAKDDKFERFESLIKKIQEKTKSRQEERKHTNWIKILICILAITLAANLIWIIIALS